MRFQIVRLPWGYFFLTMIVGDLISNAVFHLAHKSWLIFTVVVVIWMLVGLLGVVWLWNVISPLYLIIDNSELSVGNLKYGIHDIEFISMSPGKQRVVSLYLKQQRFAVKIIPRKTERDRMSMALKGWAQEHDVSTGY